MTDQKPAPSPSEQEIQDIKNDIDSIPRCKGCHELVWCDGDCCFDSAKHQREDFFKQHDTAIRNATLDALTHKLIEVVIIDGTTEFVKFPRHAISNAIDSLRGE
jgi:hypothetical protein